MWKFFFFSFFFFLEYDPKLNSAHIAVIKMYLFNLFSFYTKKYNDQKKIWIKKNVSLFFNGTFSVFIQMKNIH